MKATTPRAGNDLVASKSATAETLVVKDWYLGSQYRVEQFQFADGTVLSDTQVQPLGAPSVALVGALDWLDGGYRTELL